MRYEKARTVRFSIRFKNGPFYYMFIDDLRLKINIVCAAEANEKLIENGVGPLDKSKVTSMSLSNKIYIIVIFFILVVLVNCQRDFEYRFLSRFSRTW